jgi:hypothetical protein
MEHSIKTESGVCDGRMSQLVIAVSKSRFPDIDRLIMVWVRSSPVMCSVYPYSAKLCGLSATTLTNGRLVRLQYEARSAGLEYDRGER